MQNSIPSVLTFAGADPTSGAGLQADVLTLVSMGCHPLSVVTAVTVQDTRHVHDFMVIDADLLAEQARAVLEDGPVAVFKVGMIGSVQNMVAIAQIVSDYPDIPLVLDPILASGGGDALATEEMAGAMRELLLPLATIITQTVLRRGVCWGMIWTKRAWLAWMIALRLCWLACRICVDYGDA